MVKLLYCPEKFRDEGFPDYIERLAYCNGFSNAHKFKLWLSAIYHDKCKIFYGLDEEKYGREFDVQKRDHIPWYECRIALEFMLRRSFDHSKLNLDAYGRTYSLKKICISCWKQRPYRRYYWRDKTYNTCHTHDERLVNVKKFVYSDPEITPSPRNIDALESSVPNCPVKKAILTYYPGINLRSLESGIALSKIFGTVLFRTIRLLQERFKIRINGIYDIIKIENIVHSSLFDTLEKIADLIISQIPQHERIVRITLVICVKDSRLVYYSSAVEWMRSTAYSIHPLFYSYTFGVENSIFARPGPVVTKGEILSPLQIWWRLDTTLCKFLVESGILVEDELLHMDQLETKVWLTKGPSLMSKYKKYSSVTDVNIFDMEIMKRS